jgi:MFS family permease
MDAASVRLIHVTTVSGADPATVTEPIPILHTRPKLRETLWILRLHNYRLYFVSKIFADMGGWMARIAIDWLMLELTGNVALVGLTVSLQFLPTLLFGPWAGVISDRMNRRVILVITQSTGFVANGTLAVLVLLGAAQAWHVLLAAAISGFSLALDGPSRSAFVSEMVGTSRLRDAISLNATIFHLGGLVGPAISGVLIVVIGSGWSIGINATTSLIAALALLAMRRSELKPSPRQQARSGQIREALRYAVGKRTIFWPIVLLAFVATFGMNLPVLFTASANETYGTGAVGYGLYSSLAAVGAFLGSMLSSQRKTLRLRTIVIAAAVFGLVTMLSGIAPFYGVFLAALVGIGLARVTFAISAESLTLLSTNLGIRGRVMSFYVMVVFGGQALGGVLMGFIAENLGSRVAFIIAGGVPAIAALVVAVILARRHELKLQFRLRGVRIVRA